MKRITPVILLSMFLFACVTTKQTTNTTTNTTDSIPEKGGRVRGGADFRATGNEPFWSLDIDFKGSMHFIDVEGHEFTVPAVKGEHAMDANVTRFHSETEKGTLTVQVFNQPCEDNMSGKVNNFKVQVELKKRGDEKAQILTGCGNYVDTYEVNDIWRLESIGDKKVNTSGASTQLASIPTLEIRINDNKVFGRGGCNRYSGNFSMEGANMTFGPLMSTKMACENLALENQFMMILSDKTLSYKLTDGVLTLGSGANMLTFKRGN